MRSETASIARSTTAHVSDFDRGIEVVADAGEVGRGGGTQAGQPGPGEGRLGAAGVARAARSFDEPVVDEPVHQARHAALGQQQRIGEASHAEPPVGRLREVEERLVLLEGEGVPAPEILVEAPGDPRMGAQEGAPGPQVEVPRVRRWRFRLRSSPSSYPTLVAWPTIGAHTSRARRLASTA